MKIGYVLSVFPKLSESFILNEIIELLKMGHEVKIFSLSRSQDNVFHNEVEEYELLKRTYFLHDPRNYINKLRLGLSSLGTFGWRYPSENLKSKVLSIAAAKHYSKIAKKLDFGIIHAHFNGIAPHTAMLLAQSLRVPYTFTTHAFDIFVDPNVKALRERMKNASAIMTISYYNRNFLHDLTKIVTDKIFVIRACPNTSKLKKVERNEEDFTILTVARLVEKKGIKYGISAIKKLVKVFPEIKYRIVGSGPKKRELKEIVHLLHLENNVKFLGNLDDKCLLDEFSRATVFILPCIRAANGDVDGIPLSLMEAMYMQIPVISTAISGIPELIENGKDGLLTEPKNIEQFSSALRILLEDKNLRREIGARGRKKVENEFNVHKEVAELIDVWETITKL